MKEGVSGLDLDDCVFDVVMTENVKVKVAAAWGEPLKNNLFICFSMIVKVVVVKPN